MDTIQFIRSWSVLWLWMQYLDTILRGREVGIAYTYRKGRLDIQFLDQSNTFLLSWEKQGNQALITCSNSPSLPKKRVEVLHDIPAGSRVLSVQIHARDRLLRISLDSGIEVILGSYPGARNVYLFESGDVLGRFLKGEDLTVSDDEWLSSSHPLPADIPGGKIDAAQLQEARAGIRMEWETQQLIFGSSNGDEGMSINEFVIDVLRHSNAPKQAPVVSLQKLARTVLKRWKSKAKKITAEYEEAQSWPEIQERLQKLQIALGLGLQPTAGELQIPAEFSPSQEIQIVSIDEGVTVNQAIEATARKIRKFQSKLTQLGKVSASVEKDIRDLEAQLENPDEKELKNFLEAHGEALDQSGKQKSERKPYKKYISPGGFDILVGRTSKDNDTLTMKIANKNDWWFHARQVRGSHVILRTGNQAPSQNDIMAAAHHAALNSKSKHSGLVVVQYCQRKHLSKPKGSHPGTVLVHQESSITVSLD